MFDRSKKQLKYTSIMIGVKARSSLAKSLTSFAGSIENSLSVSFDSWSGTGEDFSSRVVSTSLKVTKIFENS